MLRKVRVYGRLAQFLGRHSFEADVNSAAEAIRFLLANFPALEAHMTQQYYKVCLAEEAIGLQDLHVEGGDKEIKIIPVYVGAGGKGMNIGMILAGVALVALSFVTFGAGAWAGLAGYGATGAFAATGSVLSFTIGAGLLLMGTAGLLTSTPNLVTPSVGGMGSYNTGTTTRDTELDPQKSYSFNGIQNTSATGAAVPVIYGETVVGSLVISAGLDTDQT